MISNNRTASIIDTIETERKAVTMEWIECLDFNDLTLPDHVTITLDRWMLNDLNLVLQKYKKEFLENDL